jgi:hypothetical protein
MSYKSQRVNPPKRIAKVQLRLNDEVVKPYYVEYQPILEDNEDDPTLMDLRIHVSQVWDAETEKEYMFIDLLPEVQKQITEQCLEHLGPR